MKNFAFSLVALFLSAPIFSQQNAVGLYFSDFQSEEAFTKVSINHKMFELAFHLETENAEEQALLDAISKIEGLTVLANQDADRSASLYSEARKRLGDEFEELMTVEDEDAEVVFLIKENGGIIRELLLICGTTHEFAVVDIWGEIDLSQIKKITDAFSVAGMKHFDAKAAASGLKVKCYPNPVKVGNHATLEVPEELVGSRWEIRNASGKQIEEGLLSAARTQLSLEGMPSGTYFVSVWKGTAKLYSEKLVVTQ